MAKIWLRVRDGLGMPVEWALSMVVQIFVGKSDIGNCSGYRAVKLLEYGMNVIEEVLEIRLCRTVTVNEMQFDFMTE